MPARDETDDGDDGGGGGAKAALVSVIESFGGGSVRDVWVLDERTEECLYIRDDIAANIEDIDVERYMDNERFGFVTRDTYNQLHYSNFAYTLRGFDTWELFRTFLVDEDSKVGVLSSLDRRDGGYDYSKLNDDIRDLLDEYDVDEFSPTEHADR